MIVDAQVHAYAASSPTWPWVSDRVHPDLPEVTGEQMVAAMEAAGVDRAVYVSPWLMYRADTGYAESVYRTHPDRFRLVAPIDPRVDHVEQRVEEWAATAGAVGYRLLFMPNRSFGADHPGVVATVRGAAAAGLPVNVQCWGRLDVIDELARAIPDAQLVLDHVGMEQPNDPPVPDNVLADLEQVVALARHPNVAIKLTGACTYSRRPFPYEDLWQPIGRVIDAFGVDRCMWGTDWTRATRILTYEQAVRAFRDHWPMSASEKATVMGGTAGRIYRWPLTTSDPPEAGGTSRR